MYSARVTRAVFAPVVKRMQIHREREREREREMHHPITQCKAQVDTDCIADMCAYHAASF